MRKKLLFTEEKSISKVIAKLAKDIKDCIIDDMRHVKERYGDTYTCQYKTNSFKLSFQDEFPFLRDVTLTYVIYLLKNEEELEDMKKLGVSLNSSYDDATNKLEITSYFIKGNPSLDFSESIMHELTHMYQYNKGMDKRRSLYDIVVDMASDNRNEFRYNVGLALYYTFPHEQDAFVHQFYTNGGDIEDFNPYVTFKTLIERIKKNYKTNKFTQRAIHELGFSYKAYFKRLHFSLKRFKRKLRNVRRYWFHEALKNALTKQPIERVIQEACNSMIINSDGELIGYAEKSNADCYDKFLNYKK